MLLQYLSRLCQCHISLSIKTSNSSFAGTLVIMNSRPHLKLYMSHSLASDQAGIDGSEGKSKNGCPNSR